MGVKVRRLSSGKIALRVAELLVDYEDKFGRIENPPVPVDEILERGLEFSLGLDDIARYGVEKTHGLTSISTREVLVDQSLDPVEHPQMEGRFNFTVAHEIGHIVLHQRVPDFQAIEFSNEPGFIGSYREFERQADKFAAHLLMPGYLLRPEWAAYQARVGAVVLTPRVEAVGIKNFGSRAEFIKAFNEEHASGLAPVFRVSVEAMRIRLEELNLLPKP